MDSMIRTRQINIMHGGDEIEPTLSDEEGMQACVGMQHCQNLFYLFNASCLDEYVTPS